MNAPAHTVAYDAIEAINWSSLVHMATSAKMLRWRVEHPRPDTPALALGRAIHCAVLEPERFERDYLVEPEFDTRSNAGKADRAAWLATLAPGYIARPLFDLRTKSGKADRAAWLASLLPDARVLIGDEDAGAVLGVETITADDHELAMRCADAVRAHPVAAEWLRGGRTEETMIWTDEETGLKCKARVDFVNPSFVLDLKSTSQQRLEGMGRDFASRLYHGQLAHYQRGAIATRRIPDTAEPPRMIVVQTVEPFDVVAGHLPYEALERGISLCRELLRDYANCKLADYWPGLAPAAVHLPFPSWTPGGNEAPEEEDW